MPYNIPAHLVGLSEEQLQQSRKQYGFNQPAELKKSAWYRLLFDILKEPMLLLLIAVSIIYLLVGDYAEALFMLAAIVVVSGISLYQDSRSKKALEALEKLNQPLSSVIRNGIIAPIPTREIAVGDLCIIEEGNLINADGTIVYSNDFSVNEAALTGESYPVYKSLDTESQQVYSGTLVVSGLAVIQVQKIGNDTELGQIGQSIHDIKETPSPLHQQISKFVKGMATIGIAIFFIVWGYSYWQSGNLVQSLLVGLTLAMSVLPEEIPVAFTTFMALGAWKLMKEGIVIKRSSIVETLGSTSVICTDKTGTITANTMQLTALYDFKSDTVYEAKDFNAPELAELIQYAMWSSEPVPFDPMEKSIHQVYEQSQQQDLRKEFKIIHEYPLEGKPPMMTHIFEDKYGQRIVAAKGAPEALLNVSTLNAAQKEQLQRQIQQFGLKGYRVLGVAKAIWEGNNFPSKQQDYTFQFLGCVIFYDPPKQGIADVFNTIDRAGIKIKVITGDNADTTRAIASQAGIIYDAAALNGTDVINLPQEELIIRARNTTLFTRMFPDAKLAVVDALKQDGQIVAMLGDGVNDAPALKAAHIGVAMGNKGTEIAKAAAMMVITNDDLGKLITAIAAGRRIYANIKKAIQYIISIHIPIILTVSLPVLLGWIYPNIFSPVHVIFMELVMGPTCSIVYENEPMEKNTMLQKPRNITDTFLNVRELGISIIQGLVITAGVLFIYQFAVHQGKNETTTRAMFFSTLIVANVFLCLVNRSFVYSLFESIRNKNKLFPLIIGITLSLLFSIIYIPNIASFFKVESLNAGDLGCAIIVAAISVLWFEIYKWIRLATSHSGK
jgi:Ca2+-transporting ATPase